MRRDGSNPAPPLADIDTQAVAVAALRALARLTRDPAWTRGSALRERLSSFRPGRAGDRGRGHRGAESAALATRLALLWADAVPDPEPFAQHGCARRTS